MELEEVNLFTTKNVILHIFKAIFISLTLILGAILIIHLDRTSLGWTPPLDSPAIYTNSYIFTVSLVKATEQLQDAMSLILSSTEVAWKNCSESVLNGWGEIQDALDHVMMNPFTETAGDELTGQIIAADGFIEACLDDLDESRAAGELRAMLLLAKVYLSGRGDFLSSYYYDDVWNRVVVVNVAWGITLGYLSYIMFCGVQLFFVFYMFHKLSKFRST